MLELPVSGRASRSALGRVLAASLVVAAASGAVASSADAADVNVTATVASSSTVTPGAALDFGALTAAQSDAQTSISVTANSPFSVGINGGANSSGTTRRLKNTSAASYIAYLLFSDAGRTTAIPTTGNMLTNQPAGTQTVNLYGRVAAGAASGAPAGSYADTLTVTVTL